MAAIADIQNASEYYSLWGLNPRPMAHKTIALATELRELLVCLTIMLCKAHPGGTKQCVASATALALKIQHQHLLLVCEIFALLKLFSTHRVNNSFPEQSKHIDERLAAMLESVTTECLRSFGRCIHRSNSQPAVAINKFKRKKFQKQEISKRRRPPRKDLVLFSI